MKRIEVNQNCVQLSEFSVSDITPTGSLRQSRYFSRQSQKVLEVL
jgi:hypothetical protein